MFSHHTKICETEERPIFSINTIDTHGCRLEVNLRYVFALHVFPIAAIFDEIRFYFDCRYLDN